MVWPPGSFRFFFGAFYLFTINTVFIGLSMVIFSQFMKFPIRKDIAESQRVRINRWISVVILVTLVPSIYFGYLLVMKERFTENANRFVRSVQVFRGDYLLRYEIDAEKHRITLIYAGRSLNEQSREELRRRSASFGLENAKISFEQGISFADITGEFGEKEKLQSQLRNLSLALDQGKKYQDSLQQREFIGRDLLRELRALFPSVNACIFSEPYRFSADDAEPPRKVAYVMVASSRDFTGEERSKITSWLKERLGNDLIRVVFEQNAEPPGSESSRIQ